MNENWELKVLDLKEKANNLPKVPGVYIMRDFMGNIIYIGKSKNLNNRVSSYFYNNKKHSSKIIQMVNNIDTFDYIKKDTELDALLLESKLIKKYKPLYNSLLKNTKSYLFIKISTDKKFPIISIESNKDDNNLYFGPFNSRGPVERTVDFIKDYFPIIKCKDPLKGNKSPCLYYDLGKCMGVCKNSRDNKEYLGYVDNIIKFLMGKDKRLIEELRNKMNEASKNLDFKSAKEYRDQLLGINYTLNRINLVENTKSMKNLLVLENIDKKRLKIFLIKGNILIDNEIIDKDSISRESFNADLKDIIIKSFNNIDKKLYKNICRDDIDEIQIINSYIKSKKEDLIYYNIPKSWIGKWDKLQELIDDLILKISF